MLSSNVVALMTSEDLCNNVYVYECWVTCFLYAYAECVLCCSFDILQIEDLSLFLPMQFLGPLVS
jgi:hypothetical protein